MKAEVALLSVALILGGAGVSASELTCADRLERTLQEMERRPLLKEEHATALMWLRLDAQKALAEGDTETCEEKVRVVEALIGLG